MKCVKNPKTKKSVRRVSDVDAQRLVVLPNNVYCPKWEWKEQQGIDYKGKK